ncbi:dehydrogenase/reductase SDR family member 12 isoform X2 [Danio aesculapii]|uniref:dehydrogenase/reductase SDR family member 12 isoform X2 n=1 Tax=Danio aesculapii TaxID=1142201 RepID=UPI0024BF7846|nr:dehydrogenase/reductase SDR family member 12 isoform X2 [Danio aesculapii]
MSLYRNILWFIKGMREYTRSGFENASKSFAAKDLDVSMVGRSFMITGANSGIGKATAMAIAKKGGTVHIVCRNKERAEKAREEIISASGNTMVFVHVLDLSESRKVWEFAEAFKKEHTSLNVLINNAGCMVNQREINSDGLEKNFATNTLGVYILTKCLIPLLEKSRDPRVRQQVVMTEFWAKAYPKIHFSVMHPGWADTPAVSSAMPQFYHLMRDRLRSAEQGSDTLIWLAMSRVTITFPSGLFFQDRQPVSVHLPLAWTHSTRKEVKAFMRRLETLAISVKHSEGDNI